MVPSFTYPQNFQTYVNLLRILDYIQISSKFLNPFFVKLFPMLGKILPHIFTESCVPKFDWSLLLKILNTYVLKLFSYAAPLPHHCVAALLPRHPICHNGKSRACEQRTKWIEDKVGTFEMQPAMNDITSITYYSSNTVIYTNVLVLAISLYHKCIGY